MSFRNATLALLTAALGLSMTVGSFAAPAASATPAAQSTKAPIVTTGTKATKNQATGTIKNWAKDSFQLQGPKGGKAWKFTYDANTKMTGKAANGATANVWWMDKGTKHIATKVEVK